MSRLPKVVTRRSKRLGRGYGSGKGGHTSSRGQKGQKSRRSMGILFEGVKVKKSLLRRLPIQRGKGKLKRRPKALVVNLSALNIMPEGSEVTIESLAKAGIVSLPDAKLYGVKILGGGVLEKKLKISLPMSKSVAERLKK